MPLLQVWRNNSYLKIKVLRKFLPLTCNAWLMAVLRVMAMMLTKTPVWPWAVCLTLPSVVSLLFVWLVVGIFPVIKACLKLWAVMEVWLAIFPASKLFHLVHSLPKQALLRIKRYGNKFLTAYRAKVCNVRYRLLKIVLHEGSQGQKRRLTTNS